MVGILKNNELVAVEEVMTNELYKLGYREIITQDIEPSQYHLHIITYKMVDDKIICIYNEAPDKDLINYKIEELQMAIGRSDYIIQKFSEYNLNPNQEAKAALKLDKYDVNTVMRERQGLRNQINELKNLLK